MSSEYQQWLDDHYDTDILNPEQIQDVLEMMFRDVGLARKRLVEFRQAAWRAEVDRREAASNEFNDFILNQYGIDRFGSMEAARKAWQERA